MEITVTQEQGRVPVTVLHVSGDIGGESYGQLEASAKKAIEDGSSYLLIDMAGVNYVGSAGIRAINQIFSWLRKLPEGEDEKALATGMRDGKYTSRRLKLVNLKQQAIKTFSTAGIDMFVEIHTDIKKAIDSF